MKSQQRTTYQEAEKTYSMICGACKANHDTVAEVKACYTPSVPADGTYAPGEFSRYDRLAFKATKSPAAQATEIAKRLPDVPSARYAVEVDGVWKFYQVDKPASGKWKGYTFVKVQAGPDTWPVKTAEARMTILASIAVDPEKALADYGHQIGKCGICNTTLTNPESIARGIGPICAAKL